MNAFERRNVLGRLRITINKTGPTGRHFGSTNENLPWYSEGLSFKCTLCGNCCSGSGGYVAFSDDEAQLMADELQIEKKEFYDKYTRTRGKNKQKRELKEVETPFGLDCIFLDRKKVPGKAVCSLYSSRPGQCRTWPFWPQNLESRESWASAKVGVDGCPGIDKGDKIAFEQIQEQLNKSQSV